MSTDEWIAFWGCTVNSSVWLSSGSGAFSVVIGAAYFCLSIVISMIGTKKRAS